MNNILIFITKPNTFFENFVNGKPKKYLWGVFFVYVFISIFWEITLGIPHGDYDIIFFDNKFLDAVFSVFLNILIIFSLVGGLYLVLNKTITTKHRLEISYLIVFSLLIISNIALSIHLIYYILFGKIISFNLLFLIIFIAQIGYFFIGVKSLFGFSIPRTLYIEFASLILAGIVVFFILLGEYYIFNINRSENTITKEKSSFNTNRKDKVLTHSTINEVIIGDKKYGLYESVISYKINNLLLFKEKFKDPTLVNIRIEDIYVPIMEKILMEYVHIEKKGDEIEFIGKNLSNRIMKECNEVLQRKKWGIQITSIEVKKIGSFPN